MAPQARYTLGIPKRLHVEIVHHLSKLLVYWRVVFLLESHLDDKIPGLSGIQMQNISLVCCFKWIVIGIHPTINSELDI